MDGVKKCLEELSLEDVGDTKASYDSDNKKKAKQDVRIKVWEKMEKLSLIKPYPLSCFDKIPHFKQCERAAKKVSYLREFKNAKCVKINPSLAQMHLRFLTLFYNKILLVPDPSLCGDFFYEINPKYLTKTWQKKRASSKAGAKEYGRKVDLNDKLHIDLYAVAAVACHKNGVRLGKGKGYAELEWAILYEMGAVSNDTVVLTTVHDEQIVDGDSLPTSLLEKHDLPVDIIVTPTKVINVRNKLPKPTHGVYWELVSEEQLESIPVLKLLRAKINVCNKVSS